MDMFAEIKQTLEKGSGKCVVLESEQPRYVVMTWKEYERIEEALKTLRRSVDIDINRIPIVE